jgi:hypothetical protein
MSSYLSSIPSRVTGSLGPAKQVAQIAYGRLKRIMADEWNILADLVILLAKTVGVSGSTDPNSHEYRLDALEADVTNIHSAVYSPGVISPAMDSAAITATTDTSDWGWGSWATIWANTETTDIRHVYALLIEGIELKGSNDGLYELELASGEAASEVVIGSVAFQATGDADVIPVPVPIQADMLTGSTRLSVRVRYDDGSTADSDVEVRVLYHVVE